MNVVFLDIDGVLMPLEAELRFYQDDNIIRELSEKYNIDYSIYDFYDVAGAYYDWDPQAIARLKYILDETDSKIIVSSARRSERTPKKMRDLLLLYGLENYYLKDNPIMKFNKVKEIQRTIRELDLTNYCVIDDNKELEQYFPDNSVITNNILSISDMNKSIKILKRKL